MHRTATLDTVTENLEQGSVGVISEKSESSESVAFATAHGCTDAAKILYVSCKHDTTNADRYTHSFCTVSMTPVANGVHPHLARSLAIRWIRLRA